MSSKLVGMVLDRYPVGGAECLLAVALADCANPDGTSIFIGVPTMARLSRQSERSVQRQLLNMQAAGWLQLVRKARPPSGTNHYRINPAWIQEESSTERGDKLSPLAPAPSCAHAVDKPVDELSTGVTKDAFRGDTAVSPNPYYPNTFKPPISPVDTGDCGKEFTDSRTPGLPKPEQPPTGMRPPWRWRSTRPGIEATAKHLGMEPWDATWMQTGQGENFLAYTERVRAAYEARYPKRIAEVEPC